MEFWQGIDRIFLEEFRHVKDRPIIYISRPELLSNGVWQKHDLVKIGVSDNIHNIVAMREQSTAKFLILAEIIFKDYSSAHLAEKIFHDCILSTYRSLELYRQTEHYLIRDSQIEDLIDELLIKIQEYPTILFNKINLYKDRDIFLKRTPFILAGNELIGIGVADEYR